MIYGHAMFIGNSQKGVRYFSSSLCMSCQSNSEKLTRFKIAVNTLKAAGEFFTKEIERQSHYNVVQIEVSFVSTRCDCDKPENINILPPLNIM